MHASLYVAFPKSEAATPSEAEEYAERFLSENGFASDDSHQFSQGYADWFVVGGRWAGDLKYWELVSRHGKAKADKWHRAACDMMPATKTRGINNLFRKLFGKDEPHLTAEQYKGCNAVLNSRALVETMLKEKMLHDDISSGGALTSPGWEFTSDNILNQPDGTVWMVVIDFHS